MRTRIAALAIVALVVFQQQPAAQTDRQPQRIVLLIDSSNATQRMIIPIRAGLLAFVDDLPNGPELAYITTGGQLQPRVKPTASRVEIRKAIEAFSSQGGANAFISAISEAYDRFLKPAEDKRPVFVIVTTESTAGRDGDVDVDRYNRFNESFRKRGGRAHAIVIGGMERGYITDVAKHVVESTGGRFERIADPTALPKLLKELAAQIAADR
jgi:Mg-chelatase subunit ChlD